MRKMMTAALIALVSVNALPATAQDVLGSLGGVGWNQLSRAIIKSKPKTPPQVSQSTSTRAAPPRNQGQNGGDNESGGSSCPRPKAGAPVDVACTLEGTWYGDVGSDPQGSSESDVTLTIRRSAPKTVTISADYKRLPTFTIRVTRAMSAIVETTGPGGVMYDPSTSPPQLYVTWPDGAAWMGHRAR